MAIDDSSMETEQSRTSVTILTDTYRIKGTIDLLPGARMTDYMMDSKNFIAITDAEVWEMAAGGRKVLEAPFIDVSRDQIQVIAPGHH